jgi:pimeloyl-ACP methyl ester carboxylesterase
LTPQFEALDTDRPVICGLSMGGCIARVYRRREAAFFGRPLTATGGDEST